MVPLLEPAGGSATIGFSTPVALPQSSGFGEPSIASAPDGTIYVTAPCPASPVWRSGDGGASFKRVGSSRGACGDSDISVSPDGTVYVSDLFNNVPVSVSHDKAATFPFVSESIGGSNDRQWLATPADGVVFSGVNAGGTFLLARSDDGAATWSQHTAFSGAGFPPPGNFIAPTVNDVYIPFAANRISLAISHDGGGSFVVREVSVYAGYTGLGGTVLFPSVARDAAGVLYVVWADNGDTHLVDGTRVRLAWSSDDGVHWSTPVTLSTPAPNTAMGTYNIMPWVVADAAGHVAVSWFQGTPPGGVRTATDAAAATAWNVQVASSSTATNAASWTVGPATGTVYTGPICTVGTGCVPVSNPVAGSRVLLDFFEMTELPDGSLAIAYPGHQPAALSVATESTQLYVVHQTGGPKLK